MMMKLGGGWGGAGAAAVADGRVAQATVRAARPVPDAARNWRRVVVCVGVAMAITVPLVSRWLWCGGYDSGKWEACRVGKDRTNKTYRTNGTNEG